MEIPDGYEKDYIAPFPIQKNPGIGKVMQKNLNALKMYTIQDLKGISPYLLEKKFANFYAK